MLVNILFVVSIYFPLYVGAIFHYDGDRERQTMAIIAQHPEQQRERITWSPILHYVARARARDMALRSYFEHVSPEGFGPNHLAHRAGFPLPRVYLQTTEQNNIESIAGNPKTAQRTVDLLVASPSHRAHILGEHPFFKAQQFVGVGMVACQTCFFQTYWVILIAEGSDVSGEGLAIMILGPGPTVPGKQPTEQPGHVLGPSPATP